MQIDFSWNYAEITLNVIWECAIVQFIIGESILFCLYCLNSMLLLCTSTNVCHEKTLVGHLFLNVFSVDVIYLIGNCYYRVKRGPKSNQMMAVHKRGVLNRSLRSRQMIHRRALSLVPVLTQFSKHLAQISQARINQKLALGRPYCSK